MGIIIGMLLALIGFAVYGIVPFVYWWFHDSLTWMQLFKTMWPWYIGGWFVQFLGMAFIKGSR